MGEVQFPVVSYTMRFVYFQSRTSFDRFRRVKFCILFFRNIRFRYEWNGKPFDSSVIGCVTFVLSHGCHFVDFDGDVSDCNSIKQQGSSTDLSSLVFSSPYTDAGNTCISVSMLKIKLTDKVDFLPSLLRSPQV